MIYLLTMTKMSSIYLKLFVGWERHYAGLSDSELAARGGSGWAPRRRLSPDAAAADSDLESVASVTSSAFSTQSERPRPTRMLRYHLNYKKKKILPLIL